MNNIAVLPQGVAVSDVRRELIFYKKIKIPILWVLENMSGFVCRHFSVSVTLPYRSKLSEGNMQGGYYQAWAI